MTNLKMHLEFHLESLSSKDVKIEDVPVRNILEDLKRLWREILNHDSLLEDGYDFRPSL